MADEQEQPGWACVTCLFYHPAYASEGNCRRYPPRGEHALSVVCVPPDYWCGEYAPRTRIKQRTGGYESV